MKRIVVTGGEGFIGKRLIEKLKKLGFDVIVLSRQQGDIAKPDYFREVQDSDIVIHLASRTFLPDSWNDSSGFISTNVLGTSNVLEYCHRSHAKLIYISAYVYGPPESLPVTESSSLNPNNPYALSKVMAENLCKFSNEFRNTDVLIIRPFNVYGPGQRSDFLIPKIVQQVIEGKEIRVFDSRPKRDYVYIDDLLDALVLAVDRKTVSRTINLGSGSSLSVNEVIEKIQNVAGTSLPVVSECLERQYEINEVYADISRASAELGWTPETSFELGVREMLKFKGLSL